MFFFGPMFTFGWRNVEVDTCFLGSERVERCWKHTRCEDFYVSLCKKQCFGNLSILGDGEGLCWRMFGTVPELLMLQKDMFWWRGTIMSRIVHRIQMSSLMLRKIKWIFQCSSAKNETKILGGLEDGVPLQWHGVQIQITCNSGHSETIEKSVVLLTCPDPLQHTILT